MTSQPAPYDARLGGRGQRTRGSWSSMRELRYRRAVARLAMVVGGPRARPFSSRPRSQQAALGPAPCWSRRLGLQIALASRFNRAVRGGCPRGLMAPNVPEVEGSRISLGLPGFLRGPGQPARAVRPDRRAVSKTLGRGARLGTRCGLRPARAGANPWFLREHSLSLKRRPDGVGTASGIHPWWRLCPSLHWSVRKNDAHC